MIKSFKAVNLLSHIASMAFAFQGVYSYLAGDASFGDLSVIVILTLTFSLFFWPLLEIAKHFTFKLSLDLNTYAMIASLVFVILSVGTTGLGISYYNESISKTSEELTLVSIDSINNRYDSLSLDIQSQIKGIAAGSEGYEAYGYERSSGVWGLNGVGRKERDRLNDLSNLYLNQKQDALNLATKINKDLIQQNEDINTSNTYSSWLISCILEFFTFFMIVLITKIKSDEDEVDTFDTDVLAEKLYQKIYKNVSIPFDTSPDTRRAVKTETTPNNAENREVTSVPPNQVNAANLELKRNTVLDMFKSRDTPTETQKSENKASIPADTDIRANSPVLQESPEILAEPVQNPPPILPDIREPQVDVQNEENNDRFSSSPSDTVENTISEGIVPKNPSIEEVAPISKKQKTTGSSKRNTKPKEMIPQGYRYYTLETKPDIVIDTTKGVKNIRE